VVIVRRNYTPPEPLRNSRSAEVAARLKRTPRADKPEPNK
jgi:hypothetical protein